MNGVFADTYFFLALLNSNDRGHAAAASISLNQYDRLITTRWILIELVDAQAAASRRAVVAAFVRDLWNDPHIVIAQNDSALFDAGLELFERRKDKEWPLTDCVSFVVMRENKIRDALTADRHFEQAGFRALLK